MKIECCWQTCARRLLVGAKKHHVVYKPSLVYKDDNSTFLYFPQPPDPQPDELVEAPTEGRGTEGGAEGDQEAGNDELEP